MVNFTGALFTNKTTNATFQDAIPIIKLHFSEVKISKRKERTYITIDKTRFHFSRNTWNMWNERWDGPAGDILFRHLHEKVKCKFPGCIYLNSAPPVLIGGSVGSGLMLGSSGGSVGTVTQYGGFFNLPISTTATIINSNSSNINSSSTVKFNKR